MVTCLNNPPGKKVVARAGPPSPGELSGPIPSAGGLRRRCGLCPTSVGRSSSSACTRRALATLVSSSVGAAASRTRAPLQWLSAPAGRATGPPGSAIGSEPASLLRPSGCTRRPRGIRTKPASGPKTRPPRPKRPSQAGAFPEAERA